MKIIGLEEHFVTRDVLAAWRALDPQWQDAALGAYEEGESARRLPEFGEDRFSTMDDVGVDVQVLSLTAPGLHNLAAADAAALQIATNDLLAEQVHARPDRFQGLATLATPSPADAARELERAVTSLGLNGGMVFAQVCDRNLDHSDFWPIFEAAAALRAPLYGQAGPRALPLTCRTTVGLDLTSTSPTVARRLGDFPTLWRPAPRTPR